MTRTLNVLEKLLRVLISCFFVAMVASITWQIVLRYVFAKANAWSEELARYSFVWLVMLAAAVGTRHARHMNIDFIVDRLPGKFKTFIELTTRFLAMTFFAVLAWKGAELCTFTMRQASTGLEIPMAYIYLAIPIGGVLMILFTLEDIFHRLKSPSATPAQEATGNA